MQGSCSLYVYTTISMDDKDFVGGHSLEKLYGSIASIYQNVIRMLISIACEGSFIFSNSSRENREHQLAKKPGLEQQGDFFIFLNH